MSVGKKKNCPFIMLNDYVCCKLELQLPTEHLLMWQNIAPFQYVIAKSVVFGVQLLFWFWL